MVKCTHCQSENTIKNGIKHDKQENYCKDCKKYFYSEIQSNENTTYEQGNDFINIICASKRLLTAEEVLEQFKVDTNVWEVDRFKVKTSEGYRKDRRVQWKVEKGQVIYGDVDDSGKMLVVPLFHIEVHLVKKKVESNLRDIYKGLKEEAKKFAPKYPKINYKIKKDGLLYEIDLPDIHLGKHSWHEESGEDFDVKIAQSDTLKAVNDLLYHTQYYNISKILIPLGNDYFNVNDKNETTVHGTKQQEDTRHQKTFRIGTKLAVQIIDLCTAIAPVEVVIVPGNHDEERIFYLGEVLEAWYSKNPNVTIDTSVKKRKYKLFGKNLIGFTHGYYEKLDKLPSLMPIEEPELWAKSKYREFHTGDKHHKKDITMVIKANEESGVTTRILRALSANDTWHFDKGYIGQIRAGEAFLWHPENGLIGQFSGIIN